MTPQALKQIAVESARFAAKAAELVKAQPDVTEEAEFEKGKPVAAVKRAAQDLKFALGRLSG